MTGGKTYSIPKALGGRPWELTYTASRYTTAELRVEASCDPVHVWSRVEDTVQMWRDRFRDEWVRQWHDPASGQIREQRIPVDQVYRNDLGVPTAEVDMATRQALAVSRRRMQALDDALLAARVARGEAVRTLQDGLAEHEQLRRLRQQYDELAAQQLQRLAVWNNWNAFNTFQGTDSRSEAQKKARNLLRQLLSEEQWTDYEKRTRFIVEKNGTRYELGGTQVVVLGDKGDHVESWCVYCPEGPWEDTIIAHFLHLMRDPAALRAQANVTKYGRGAAGVPIREMLMPGLRALTGRFAGY